MKDLKRKKKTKQNSKYLSEPEKKNKSKMTDLNHNLAIITQRLKVRIEKSGPPL